MPTKTAAKKGKAEAPQEPAPVAETLAIVPEGPAVVADRDLLAELAAEGAKRISTRSALPALAGVKIDLDEGGKLRFSATDLETFYRTEREGIAGHVASWVVPARPFAALLKGLPAGKVTLTGRPADGRLFAEGQPVGEHRTASNFWLSTMPTADFPAEPGVRGATCEIDGRSLERALRRVRTAISTDEGSPLFTGASWSVRDGKLTLVATDKYRLAIDESVEVECSGTEMAVVVPGSALARLPAIGDRPCRVVLGELQAEFEIGSTKVVTRLIEGRYPDWPSLLPTELPNKLRASKADLLREVEAAAVIAKANTPVKFHLGDEVCLTALQTGVGEAKQVPETAEWDGPEMVAGFNPGFFAEGLKAIESDEVVVDFTDDPGKPAILRAAEPDGFRYLLMPVRLWAAA